MNFLNEPSVLNEHFCDGHWEDTYLDVFYKVFVSLYIFLTITAISGNSLILVALSKDSSLHQPSKLLLKALTVTDLCVGAIAQPLAITFLWSTVNDNWTLCRVTEYSLAFSTTVFSGASLSIVTAISIDRLLALLLRLRYKQVVTLKKVRVIVFLCWIKSASVAILYLGSVNLFFVASAVLILLEVFISIFSYSKIIFSIRRQQTQVQDVLSGGNMGPNIVQYKRTVSSALWIHFSLVLCYIPLAAVTAVLAVHGSSHVLSMAEFLTVSLVYLNSSLNPVLYCWKIREVRVAVKQTLRQIFSRL